MSELIPGKGRAVFNDDDARANGAEALECREVHTLNVDV